MTISEALKQACEKIDRIDAQYLLADLLKIGRASLFANGERALTEREEAAFLLGVLARAQGRPIAYILGSREFYGRDFLVNESVLIPRPETELLIEQALARLSGQEWPEKPVLPCVLDAGTGSGAIAVTLAMEYPDCEIAALDKSAAALAVARKNAQKHFADGADIYSLTQRKKIIQGGPSSPVAHAPIEFIESNWFASIKGRRFDLIVSNPPYIAGEDSHLVDGDLRFEPSLALTDGSTDGLDSIRHIIIGAREHLSPNGWLLFEHGYDQAAAARELLLKTGFENLICERDLAGIERVSGGQIR